MWSTDTLWFDVALLMAMVVVGHILFSPAMIGTVEGAALGPMAVVPSHQRQGIGGHLIVRGLENAIKSRRVTYDLARQMPGASEVSTSVFADQIIKGMSA